MNPDRQLPVPMELARPRGQLALYLAGWAALVLGAVGAVLPIMPTAPFLLVAAACFSKSSPSMYQRIIDLPVIGKYIDDVKAGRGVSPKVRWFSVAGVWLSVSAAAGFIVKEGWGRLVLIAIAVGATLSLLSLPGRKRDADASESQIRD